MTFSSSILVRRSLEKLLTSKFYDELIQDISEKYPAPILYISTPFQETPGYTRRPSRGGSLVEAAIEALDVLEKFPRINLETPDGEGLIGLRREGETLIIEDLVRNHKLGRVTAFR